MLNYGIVGFGGLGKHHFSHYQTIKEKTNNGVNLVALCDIEDDAFTTAVKTNLNSESAPMDLSMYNIYKDVDEMIEKEKLDFVITALPTYIHAEVAVKLLNKGIHVLSEKPMALTLEGAEAMLNAARKNNVKLMIGQCVRYMVNYEKAKEIIDSEEYGKVVKASFSRLSQTPTWGWKNWFCDDTLSGGVMLDMHVHDVDFINYVFGMPKSVKSYARTNQTKRDSVITYYEYDDKLVTSDAEWCQSSYSFKQSFFIKMEKAVLEFAGGKLRLYPEGGEATDIEVEFKHHTVREQLDFINSILTGNDSLINPPEASLNSLRIALAEIKSADTKEIIYI